MERESLLNSIARSLNGETSIHQDLYKNLLTQNSIYTIINNFWETVKRDFWDFSMTSAGIFGIISIFYIIKSVLSAILNFFQLQRIYGFSFYLLGAIFTSITNFLVQLSTYEDKNIDTNTKTNPTINYQTNKDEVKINIGQNENPNPITIPPPIPTTAPYVEPKSFHSFDKNFKFYKKHNQST